LAGWAAAGDAAAAEAITQLAGEAQEIAQKLVAVIDQSRPGPPMHLLKLAERGYPKFPDETR
jgi:hypothetical protein